MCSCQWRSPFNGVRSVDWTGMIRTEVPDASRSLLRFSRAGSRQSPVISFLSSERTICTVFVPSSTSFSHMSSGIAAAAPGR